MRKRIQNARLVLWCLLITLAMGLSTERTLSVEKGKQLSESDILELLSGDVPTTRVAELVKERGIDFTLTPERERKFRAAKATPELIDALREASKRKTDEEQPRTGTLNLQSKPGEAEVYLNDEPKGMTSPEGKLVLPDLPPGNYTLRVSLLGYQSWENKVDIIPGENPTIFATLTERPSVAPAESVTPPVVPGRRAVGSGPLPVPNARVTAVRFFESGTQVPEKNSRQYQDRFDTRTIRFVYWELSLGFPKIQSRIDFDIDAVWYGPDGNVVWRQTRKVYVLPGWTTSWHIYGWGCNTPPCRGWKVGRYRVELLVGSSKVASGSFEAY
jgi:hypothetical protein